MPPPPRRRWRLIDYPRAGKRGWRRWVPSWLFFTGTATACVMALMLAFVLMYYRTDLPDTVNAFLEKQSSIIYYGDGSELARIGETNREEINIADMPLHLREAVIAAENKSFYSDKGFSPTGIARAVINNVRGGDTQGGSTITQQYAKLAFTNQEQTIQRKIEELFISIKLEETYTKDQILQDYLNAVYLGRGAYGVQAASRVYFGKQAKDMTVAESAVLAALLRSPEGLYSPDRSEESRQRLEARWAWVLDQMIETGALNPAEKAELEFPEIKEFEPKNRYAGNKGYLMAQVERELRESGLDIETIRSGGLKIYTTIDKDMQKAAVEAVNDNRQEEDAEDVHIALVSVEPGTGAIKASYGGADFLDDNFDNALLAEIQPGSTFKAFGLAAALSDDHNLSLTRNAFQGNDPYTFADGSPPVRNCCDSDGSDYGMINLLQATERSVNTAFVDAASKVIGTDDVVDAAVAAGLPREKLDANARTVIGIYAQRPVDMANAYATFAAGGIYAPVHIVDKAFYPNGTPVELKIKDPETGDLVPRPEPTRVFTERQAAGVQYALRQPVEGNNGTSVRARELGRPVAGKTGTHEDLTAWFVGFTPNQLATAVAIYRDDRKENDEEALEPLDGYGGRRSVTGNSFPLSTWLDYMSTVLDDQPVTQFLPFDDSGGEVVNPFPRRDREPDPPGNGNGNGGNGGGGGGNGGGDGDDVNAAALDVPILELPPTEPPYLLAAPSPG